MAGDGGGERSACGRDPPKFFYFKIRSRCVLLVACCLWIYLASQEFSSLVPMLAKLGRRLLAVQDLRLRLGAAGPPGKPANSLEFPPPIAIGVLTDLRSYQQGLVPNCIN